MGRGIYEYAAALKKSLTSNAPGRFLNYNACNTCRAHKKENDSFNSEKKKKNANFCVCKRRRTLSPQTLIFKLLKSRILQRQIFASANKIYGKNRQRYWGCPPSVTTAVGYIGITSPNTHSLLCIDGKQIPVWVGALFFLLLFFFFFFFFFFGGGGGGIFPFLSLSQAKA